MRRELISGLIRKFRDTLYESRYQIFPRLFRGIDQSVLRSDAPTIIRGLPKFVRPARELILDSLLAHADAADGRYHASEAHVIKHGNGRGAGEKERKREKQGEREGKAEKKRGRLKQNTI